MTTTRTNYDVLYSALKIFRDSMLPFLIEKLQETYGASSWWHDGVKRVVGERAITEMETAYERRYGKPMSPLTRGYVELYEMLDINRFLPLVEGNWRAFSKTLGEIEVAKVWLREINTVRNAVAHPESGDLPDSDAVRGLDTMRRLLRLVNPEEAKKIEELQKELQSAAPGHRYPMREGALDYERAFLELGRSIAKHSGEESPELHDLELSRRTLLVLEGEHDLGADAAGAAEQRSEILARVDEIAQRFKGRSFAELAQVSPLPSTPEETHLRIVELETEMAAVEYELKQQDRKLQIQRETGSVLPPLTRAIARNRKLLEKCKAERDHIGAVAAPPAFFRLRRILDPLPSPSYVEGQSFEVVTSLTNLGREVVLLRYADSLQGMLTRIEGPEGIEETVVPGMTVSLRYRCAATGAGQFRISPKLVEYEGRSAIWDELPDTTLTVRRGTDPRVEVARYYQHEPNGLRVLVSIENKGERRAVDVRLRDEIDVDGKPAPVVIAFDGTIENHEKKAPLECVLEGVIDLHSVHFAASVVTYADESGARYEAALGDSAQQVERNFTAVLAETSLIGRESLLRELEDGIGALVDAARQRALPPQLKLVAIEGMEGMGKSRLVQELASCAEERGAVTGILDLARVMSVRALVAELFGTLEELDEGALDIVLHENFPGEGNAHVRDALRQLALDIGAPSVADVERLAGNIIASLRALTREHAVVLFIENAHIRMEGLEEAVMRHILDDAVTLTSSYLFVCVTHRPTERGPFALASRPIASTRRNQIVLEALPDADVRRLIRRLAGFPSLNESLEQSITTWCKGNPMYVIEAVRVLLKTPGLLIRVGGEWYPDGDAAPQFLAAKGLRDLVRERIQNELPPELAEFARRLAAIGFEIPVPLAEVVFAASETQWTKKIELLEEAGIIVLLNAGSAGQMVYQFEHEVKYDVLREAIPAAQRSTLAREIAEALLHHQDIYRSPDEQLCQFAHHAAEAPLAYQRENAERLLDAANLESDRRNFTQSLKLYQALIDVLPKESPEAVEVRIERSRVYQKRGNYVAAKAEIDAANEQLRPGSALSKNKKELRRLDVAVLTECGLIALNQEQSAMSAEKYLIKARDRLDGLFFMGRVFHPTEDAEYYRSVVAIQLGLAEAHLQASAHRKSRRACRRAEAAALAAKKKQLNDGSLLSEVYLTLGRLHAERSSPDAIEEAQVWYQQALAQAGDDPYESERILSAWADALREAGRYEDAAKKYDQAIAGQKQLHDQRGLALSFSGLGMLYEDWPDGYDPQKVQFYYEQTIENLAYLVDPPRLWRASAGLARIHLDRGDAEKAWQVWPQARALLFDGDIFQKLTDSRRANITTIVEGLCDYFKASQRWPELEFCAADLAVIHGATMSRTTDFARAMLAQGDALAMTGRWADAETAYRAALEDAAALRGEAYARLGDLFASHTPKLTLTEADADPEKTQDQAELYYTEAVIAFLRRGEMASATEVYGKLIRRLTSDESGLLEIPHVLLRILRGAPPDIVVHRRIIEDAADILIENRLWADAADILVYALREWIRRPDTSVPESLEESYMQRAEELYRRGTPDQLMYGLNMLISVHFELKEWDDIVECFGELFEINVQRSDPEEVVGSLVDITSCGDRFEVQQVVHFIELAEAAPSRLAFDSWQRARLLLYVGKLLHRVSDGCEKAEEPLYQQRALDHYDEALRLTPSSESEFRGTVLNDTAIIFWRRRQLSEALRRLEEAVMIEPDGSRVRTNHAGVLLELGRQQEAAAEFEKALDIAREQHYGWQKRLERQKEAPLTADEILNMAYDTESLANLSGEYGLLLIDTFGDEARGRHLVEHSTRLYAEIGKESHEAALLRQRDMMVGASDFQALLARLGVSPEQIAEIGAASEPRLLARDTPCPHCEAMIPAENWVCEKCEQRICPYCHTAVQSEVEECEHCRTDLCSTCGGILEDDPPACPNCGAPVRWVAGGERPGPGEELEP